jgi:hypothetical protein
MRSVASGRPFGDGGLAWDILILIKQEPGRMRMTHPVRDRTRLDCAGLIEPARVHGSLYTDPRVFADELDRIWYRTWVYVGHESEVAEPGDYVRKSIGLQDLIMTRGLRRRGPPAAQPVCAPGQPGLRGRTRPRQVLPLPVSRLDLPEQRGFWAHYLPGGR